MVMPEAVKSLYARLQSDLLELFFRWRSLGTLFAESETRVALLNETAPAFFAEYQRLAAESLVVGVVRLTDKPAGKGERRLVLASLLDVVHDEVIPSLQVSLDAAEAAALPLRAYRDKLIAHRDRAVAMRAAETVIPNVTYGQLSRGLDRCGEVLNTIQRYYEDSSTGYRESQQSLKGAPAIVFALQKSVVMQEMLESGEVPWQRIVEHRLGGA